MTLKNITVSLLLLFAVGLSTWSILFSKQISPANNSAASHHPDAFLEDVIATVIDKYGKPALKVVTPFMMHYSDDDSTDMKNPFITIYRHDSPNPWYITAKSATALQGTEQIIFKDNVVIHHPADANNPVTTMNTNSLTIFPNRQVAQTNEPVLITQPAATIHAVGMLANLNDGTVKLLSQTKEEYVPNS